MQATLPKELLDEVIEKRLEDMEIGESGTCPPYAMAADDEDRLWLDPGALVAIEDRGSFVVSRTEEGYKVRVNVDSVNYRWKRNEMGNNQWDRHTVPVVEISTFNNIVRSF